MEGKKSSKVKVAVRVRPLSNEELHDGECFVVDRGSNSIIPQIATTTSSGTNGRGGVPGASQYGCVFGPESSTRDVYDSVGHELVDEFLSGYNATLFAYGQTGSGKTFTTGFEVKNFLLPPQPPSAINSEQQGSNEESMAGGESSNAASSSSSSHLAHTSGGGLVQMCVSELLERLSAETSQQQQQQPQQQQVFPGASAAAGRFILPSDVKLTASFIEIYNEKVKDLLLMPESFTGNNNGQFLLNVATAAAGPAGGKDKNGSKDGKNSSNGSSSGSAPAMTAAQLAAAHQALANGEAGMSRIIKDSFGNTCIDGVTQVPICSLEDLNACLRRGAKRRATGRTNMNETSSRSHAIFTLHLERIISTSSTGGSTATSAAAPASGEAASAAMAVDGNAATEAAPAAPAGLTVLSLLRFVDLAGSERAGQTGATGIRFQEGTKINTSLSVLGKCIVALANKAKHVPFRESMLTRLLENSLGGNSATVMIACISPANKNFTQSMSTLSYASRAACIENRLQKNIDPSAAVTLALQSEMAAAKAELSRLYGLGVAVDEKILDRFKIGPFAALGNAGAAGVSTVSAGGSGGSGSAANASSMGAAAAYGTGRMQVVQKYNPITASSSSSSLPLGSTTMTTTTMATAGAAAGLTPAMTVALLEEQLRAARREVEVANNGLAMLQRQLVIEKQRVSELNARNNEAQANYEHCRVLAEKTDELMLQANESNRAREQMEATMVGYRAGLETIMQRLLSSASSSSPSSASSAWSLVSDVFVSLKLLTAKKAQSVRDLLAARRVSSSSSLASASASASAAADCTGVVEEPSSSSSSGPTPVPTPVPVPVAPPTGKKTTALISDEELEAELYGCLYSDNEDEGFDEQEDEDEEEMIVSEFKRTRTAVDDDAAAGAGGPAASPAARGDGMTSKSAVKPGVCPSPAAALTWNSNFESDLRTVRLQQAQNARLQRDLRELKQQLEDAEEAAESCLEEKEEAEAEADRLHEELSRLRSDYASLRIHAEKMEALVVASEGDAAATGGGDFHIDDAVLDEISRMRASRRASEAVHGDDNDGGSSSDGDEDDADNDDQEAEDAAVGSKRKLRSSGGSKGEAVMVAADGSAHSVSPRNRNRAAVKRRRSEGVAAHDDAASGSSIDEENRTFLASLRPEDIARLRASLEEEKRVHEIKAAANKLSMRTKETTLTKQMVDFFSSSSLPSSAMSSSSGVASGLSSSGIPVFVRGRKMSVAAAASKLQPVAEAGLAEDDVAAEAEEPAAASSESDDNEDSDNEAEEEEEEISARFGVQSALKRPFRPAAPIDENTPLPAPGATTAARMAVSRSSPTNGIDEEAINSLIRSLCRNPTINICEHENATVLLELMKTRMKQVKMKERQNKKNFQKVVALIARNEEELRLVQEALDQALVSNSASASSSTSSAAGDDVDGEAAGETRIPRPRASMAPAASASISASASSLASTAAAAIDASLASAIASVPNISADQLRVKVAELQRSLSALRQERDRLAKQASESEESKNQIKEYQRQLLELTKQKAAEQRHVEETSKKFRAKVKELEALMRSQEAKARKEQDRLQRENEKLKKEKKVLATKAVFGSSAASSSTASVGTATSAVPPSAPALRKGPAESQIRKYRNGDLSVRIGGNGFVNLGRVVTSISQGPRPMPSDQELYLRGTAAASAGSEGSNITSSDGPVASASGSVVAPVVSTIPSTLQAAVAGYTVASLGDSSPSARLPVSEPAILSANKALPVQGYASGKADDVSAFSSAAINGGNGRFASLVYGTGQRRKEQQLAGARRVAANVARFVHLAANKAILEESEKVLTGLISTAGNLMQSLGSTSSSASTVTASMASAIAALGIDSSLAGSETPRAALLDAVSRRHASLQHQRRQVQSQMASLASAAEREDMANLKSAASRVLHAKLPTHVPSHLAAAWSSASAVGMGSHASSNGNSNSNDLVLSPALRPMETELVAWLLEKLKDSTVQNYHLAAALAVAGNSYGSGVQVKAPVAAALPLAKALPAMMEEDEEDDEEAANASEEGEKERAAVTNAAAVVAASSDEEEEDEDGFCSASDVFFSNSSDSLRGSGASSAPPPRGSNGSTGSTASNKSENNKASASAAAASSVASGPAPLTRSKAATALPPSGKAAAVPTATASAVTSAVPLKAVLKPGGRMSLIRPNVAPPSSSSAVGMVPFAPAGVQPPAVSVTGPASTASSSSSSSSVPVLPARLSLAVRDTQSWRAKMVKPLNSASATSTNSVSLAGAAAAVPVVAVAPSAVASSSSSAALPAAVPTAAPAVAVAALAAVIPPAEGANAITSPVRIANVKLGLTSPTGAKQQRAATTDENAADAAALAAVALPAKAAAGASAISSNQMTVVEQEEA